MKIYINTDLEGICGFVDWEEAAMQTGRGTGYTKRFLTAEVNAAVEGILAEESNAEIVVQDGHGGGWQGPNIIIEELHPRAAVIFGKRNAELAGLDRGFDLMMCIGAHSMAGTQYGVMNHTIGIDSVHNVWINGVRAGEIGIWAAIAGAYELPLGMVSGDHWAIEEAKTLLGGIEGVAVKKGVGQYAAECLNPAEARRQIKEAARAAVAQREQYKPYKVRPPVELKIEYSFTNHADTAERRGAERLDGRTVCFRGNDVLPVFNQASL